MPGGPKVNSALLKCMRGARHVHVRRGTDIPLYSDEIGQRHAAKSPRYHFGSTANRILQLFGPFDVEIGWIRRKWRLGIDISTRNPPAFHICQAQASVHVNARGMTTTQSMSDRNTGQCCALSIHVHWYWQWVPQYCRIIGNACKACTFLSLPSSSNYNIFTASKVRNLKSLLFASSI